MAFGTDAGRPGSIAPKSEDEGDFIGLMMLPPAHGPDQPDDPTVAELGYRIVRRHWRKGLASEAARALLQHAFETVGQRRVIAQTMAVNLGSRGVMEAVGMRYVRTYFASWEDPLPGSDQGEVEYEMTRETWPKAASSGGCTAGSE
jgi:RimJ/RimL family protein N-acetyltransferase